METKTLVAELGDTVDSKEESRKYSDACRQAKEQQIRHRLNLISFEDYKNWALNNQLPII